MKDYDDATYEIETGPKGLYTVIEWTDGKSLFLDGDSELIFMEEYMEARQLRDYEWMEKLFGIGSEWHTVADLLTNPPSEGINS
tara:strand:- start:323 stop:574 length:252 start_codon:yes stop_codon:yes gene_type:complete